MTWADQTYQHEKKIRRHSFYVGVGVGVILSIASVPLIDYIIGVLRHT